MGVEGFFKIRIPVPGSKKTDPKKLLADLGKDVTLKELSGSRVGIDASLMIYNSLLAVEHLQSLTDSEGKPTAHINTIFYKILQLASFKIQQVWIFDSPKPNELKKYTIEKRRGRKAKALEKNYKNKEKMQYSLNKENVEEIQYLLNKLGIMYITAPDGIEAEQYGAYLTKGIETERFCKYIISGDSDVLCFGGNLLRLTTRKSESGKTKKTIYKVFELEELLAESQLTYPQFLEMCVSMGTDFAEGTPGIGPATALEKAKRSELLLTPRQEMVMEYFQKNIIDRIGEAEIVKGKFDPEEVVKFLKMKSFNEERVRKALEKYKTLDDAQSEESEEQKESDKQKEQKEHIES